MRGTEIFEMKIVTFAVPCYNSESYMRKCLDSLLTVGDDCEIIIVNDGSKDGTAAIADEYAAAHPSIVSVVHKENGGHGSGVNAGLERAKGLYYKVVDSDDWIDEGEMGKLLALMKEHIAGDTSPDLYLTNYVYEHVADNAQFVRRYTKQLPENVFFGWDEVGKFVYSEMLMMHSLWYKTESVRASGVRLPEHTYYVDDIFCYTPMPHMHKMYYLNVDIYRYFIGRADQSVNITNAGKNYKMMLRVMTELVNVYDIRDLKKQSKQLFRYMRHCLHAFMMVTCCFAAAKGTKEAKQDIKELWRYIKKQNRWTYRNLAYNSYNMLARLPWPISKRLLIAGYKNIRKRVKFG